MRDKELTMRNIYRTWAHWGERWHYLQVVALTMDEGKISTPLQVELRFACYRHTSPGQIKEIYFTANTIDERSFEKDHSLCADCVWRASDHRPFIG